MKSIFQKIQYIILVGLFSFVAVTPAYAQGGLFRNMFGRFFANTQQHDVNEVTASPKPTFPPKNTPRGVIHENVATHPGVLRGFWQTRAIILGNITAINGTTLTVLGKDRKTYIVQTDDKTQFRRWRWGKGSLSEIQVNDQVSVIGKWTDDAHTIIQATLVRDLSIQKFLGVFFGKVQSLTSSGWIMTTMGRGNQTVTVSSSTKFTDRRGQAISQSDIAVGHMVRIRGMWDRKASTITEVTAVKDFSLPVKPTSTTTTTVAPTATPMPTETPTP